MTAKKESSTIALHKSGNVNTLNSDARGIFELNVSESTKVSLGLPSHLPGHRLITSEKNDGGGVKLKVLLAKGEYIRCVSQRSFRPAEWSPTFAGLDEPVIVDIEEFFKVTVQSGRKRLVLCDRPEGVRFSNLRFSNAMASEVYKIVWGELFKDFPMVILQHHSTFNVRFVCGTRSLNELKAASVLNVEDGKLKLFNLNEFNDIQGTGRLFLAQCYNGDFVYLTSDEKLLKATEAEFIKRMEQFDRVDLYSHGGSISVFPSLPKVLVEHLNKDPKLASE